ncbi:MAG: hypothetical protein ACOYBP_00980 [Microbacteriaceae bacterium]
MNLLSGGVLFAVGALLWVAYLLPTMVKRRQLQSAELETAKLQQVLHTLAETGELPADELSARDQIAERKRQHKLERVVERENLKALHVAEGERKAEAKAARVEARHSAIAKREALIRRRMAAAWMLLISVLVIVGGSVAIFFGVTWMIAGAGAIVAVVSMVSLRQVVHGLAELGDVSGASTARAGSALVDLAPPVIENARTARTWTPQSLPSPLTAAAGSQAASTIASNDAMEALRRRAREMAAEIVSSGPPLPTVAAARNRAESMAAHPATYGKQRRQAMLNGGRTAQVAASAAAAQRPMTTAEQVAARYANFDATTIGDETAFDLSEVLQRRRAV